MTKYKAYWVNKKEEDKVYSVVVELPHLETVGEAIRDVLPLINAELEAEESAYVLSEDPKQFDLFQAKKTGHAKTDYPGTLFNHQRTSLLTYFLKLLTLDNCLAKQRLIKSVLLRKMLELLLSEFMIKKLYNNNKTRVLLRQPEKA